MAKASSSYSSTSLPTPPSHWGWGLTLAGSLVGILLFLGLMLLTYVRHSPKRPDRSLVQERLQKVAEVNTKQAALIQGYEWVDQTAGIVRIPVARAMELVVQEHYTSGHAQTTDTQPPH